ncbi:MAG: glycosyltransferase family 2 protein [Limisphaerales bacterium]
MSQSKSNPSTSIIVVGYHGKEWIKPCLDSLVESFEQPEHVCLVDNSGNEGAIPETLDGCRYTLLKTDQPLGFAEANNFALEELDAPERYICFLNQDTLSRPGWIQRCAELLDENPEIGAVTPMLFAFGWELMNPNFYACMKANPELLELVDAGQELKPYYEVPNIPAAAMVIRSSVLAKVGPFDPVFGSYFEDFDLCCRVRQAGYQVGVCTTAEVAHYDSITDAHINNARNRRRQMLILRNKSIMDLREAGTARFVPLCRQFVSVFPRQLFRRLLGRPGAKSLRAIIKAYAGLLALSWRLLSAKRDHSISQSFFQRFGERFAARFASEDKPTTESSEIPST